MMSERWYRRSGQPCYTLPNKSKPGTMRATTKADAKKLDLVPSVTTISKIVYSFGLERWKEGQILQAAWEYRVLGLAESIERDQWCAAVKVKANEISSTASDTGEDIHHAILDELLVTGKLGGPYMEWQKTFADWWKKQEWFGKMDYMVTQEGYIPTNYGYGGRFDIYVQAEFPMLDIILDLKTQNAKGKPFTFYRSWGRQLAAYAQALAASRLISIVMDSQDSERIEAYEWPDYGALLKEFEASQLLWTSENGFN